MNWKAISLAAALAVALAAPAMAGGGSVGLTAGGPTLAGPGATSLAMNGTETVYTHPATNTNACATVANVGGSPVQATLVGPSNSTATMDVPMRGTGALCKDSLLRMDLTCLGTSSCAAQWRVDAN